MFILYYHDRDSNWVLTEKKSKAAKYILCKAAYAYIEPRCLQIKVKTMSDEKYTEERWKKENKYARKMLEKSYKRMENALSQDN